MMMLAVVSIPSPARAQSSADEPIEVPVHPGVTTVLHFPDDIEHVRFTTRVAGSLWARTVAHRLYVRPYRRAPAGMKIALEVTTATMYQRFRLRVTRRARDADRIFVVRAPEPQPPAEAPAPGSGEATPDAAAAARDPAAPDVADAPRTQVAPDVADAPRTQVAPDVADALRTTASTPGPAAPAPRADREPARAGPVTAAAASEQLESVTAAAASEQMEPVPARAAASAPRFELAVHALVALPGFTSMELAGNAPGTTWRAHRGLGVRLTAGPAGGWWNLEADVSGTWLAGALTYEGPFAPNQLEVSGPLLRAELGVRVSSGARWRPSLYVGIGAQAHLRRTRTPDDIAGWQTTATMEDGAVQVRRGGPDDYRSMTALWTVGYRLDPGE